MTNRPITFEDMQPQYNREVSFLLAHAFQGKFAALTKLDIRSLANPAGTGVYAESAGAALSESACIGQ